MVVGADHCDCAMCYAVRNISEIVKPLFTLSLMILTVKSIVQKNWLSTNSSCNNSHIAITIRERFQYLRFTLHKTLVKMISLSDVSNETSHLEMASSKEEYFIIFCFIRPQTNGHIFSAI